MRPQVAHNLQLWHQGLSLALSGCCWMKAENKWHFSFRFGDSTVKAHTASVASWPKVKLGWQANSRSVKRSRSAGDDTLCACYFPLCILHLSIFTATFVRDWEWARQYAVASTTLPKAPDPRVRPETQRKDHCDQHSTWNGTHLILWVEDIPKDTRIMSRNCWQTV